MMPSLHAYLIEEGGLRILFTYQGETMNFLLSGEHGQHYETTLEDGCSLVLTLRGEEDGTGCTENHRDLGDPRA